MALRAGGARFEIQAARFEHEARRKVEKRQSLYTLTQLSEADVVADGFLDRFIDICRRAAPMIEFQTKALGLRW